MIKAAQKGLAIFLLFGIAIFLFFPLLSFADGTYKVKEGGSFYDVNYTGLVPCGKKLEVNGTSEFVNCQFCHVFIMANGIFKFVLIDIIPPLAVLMLVAGGIIFYFSGGDPSKLAIGKNLIKGVIIGIIIAYGSYMIIGFFLTALGAANINPIKDLFGNGVFTVNCQIEL